MYVTVYVYMNVCGVHTTVLMQRSEDNLQELALFYHVGPRNQIQVVRLGSKYLYLLSQLGPYTDLKVPCFYYQT